MNSPGNVRALVESMQMDAKDQGELKRGAAWLESEAASKPADIAEALREGAAKLRGVSRPR